MTIFKVVIFQSYVSLPEGILTVRSTFMEVSQAKWIQMCYILKCQTVGLKDGGHHTNAQ